MVTKEYESKKYCCFYASDFHLEMILLPYIKKNIDKTKFVIFTQENLLESMRTLLDRTNLNLEEKNKILNLNWNNKKIDDISNCDFNNYTFIINGNNDYILKINEEIKKLKIKKINIIDCYNINEKKLKTVAVQENYDEILNTKKYV
jgi:hypothetical protein